MVYDITDEQSFLNCRNWIRNVEQHKDTNTAKMVLIGNKCDLTSDRVLTTVQGERLAEEYGIKYFETSAKTGQNIIPSVVSLATDIIEQKIASPLAPLSAPPAPPSPPVDTESVLHDMESESINIKCCKRNCFDNENLKKSIGTPSINPYRIKNDIEMIENTRVDMKKNYFYSFYNLKIDRDLEWSKLFELLLLYLLLPVLIIHQFRFFIEYNYRNKSKKYRKLLPKNFNLWDVKSRMLIDIFDPIFGNVNDIVSIDKYGLKSFAKQNLHQMTLRYFLTIYTIFIYGTMIVIFFIGETKNNLTFIESRSPLLIFLFLISSMSLWMAFSTDRSNLPATSVIGLFPLYFNQIDTNIDKIIWDKDYTATNIIQFRVMIDNYRSRKKIKFHKRLMVRSFPIIFSIIYSLLPSFVRLETENLTSMIPNNCDPMVWFLCILCNFTFIYVCIGLCVFTTKESFEQLLDYMEYFTII